ncbi:MAG TPA: GNAT family N-acyltransferase [Planctomycetota bacterium]|nr:GNAT family N-acyltransferase [Planctomycetota bacterium]
MESPTLRQPAATDRLYPRGLASLPDTELPGCSYLAHFARTRAELEAIQRLRFEVFNLELGEGLESSFATGLDQDQYDEGCHHLLVSLRATGEVVGTYRMQTLEMAEAHHGLYSAGEFDLARMPREVLVDSVETGRACVAKEHRNGRVLTLLWKGLAAYLLWNRRRYMFGCCSLTSQDPHVARQTYEFLRAGAYLHPTLEIPPHAHFACYPSDFVPDPNVTVKLPALFAGYLKLGAKITGEPALDREFKTIDFLTLVDLRTLDASTLRTFFGAGGLD